MDIIAQSFGSSIGDSITGDSEGINFNAVFAGLCIAVLLAVVIYYAITKPQKHVRADTKVSGFYGGPITGTSNISCGRMSSEAEELYSIFSSRNLKVGEEGKSDLRDLKNLLSKLCCLKEDLMSPQKTVAASKKLGFATHQDIQPLGDLAGRCFSKTIPEHDLSLQFIKWRESGKTLLYKLCTEASLSENEVINAENLFMSVWKDVNDVANTQCLTVLPTDKVSRHEPEPSLPRDIYSLKNYDGLY